MEIQPPPIKHPPSPTLSSSAAIISSDSLSHHSSPAKTSRVHYHHHHQVTTIDETTTSMSRVPLSVSSHHQLVAALNSPISPTGPQPSISGVSALQLQMQQRQNMMTQTTHTGHLALLYHSSSHHHHHLHPALPPVRRPSRLPPVIITRQPEIKAYDSHSIGAVCRFSILIFLILFSQKSNAGDNIIGALWQIISCDGNCISNGRSYIDVHSTIVLWGNELFARGQTTHNIASIQQINNR